MVAALHTARLSLMLVLRWDFFYNWRKPFILATALPSVQCRSGEMDYDIFVKEKLLLGKWGKIHTSWKGR